MYFIYNTYEQAFRAWQKMCNRFAYYIEELEGYDGTVEGYVIIACCEEEENG